MIPHPAIAVPQPKARLDGGAQPLLFASLAFALGILCARYWWHPPLLWLGMIVASMSLAATLLIRRSSLAFTSSIPVLFLCGGFIAQFASVPVTVPDLSRLTTGEEVVLTGYVARDGVIREGSFGRPQESVDFKAEHATLADGSDTASDFIVRLNVFTGTPLGPNDESEQTSIALPQLKYGQRLILTAKLRQPKNYGNAGAFDYRFFLAKNGVAALGSARFDSIRVVPGFAGSHWQRWRSVARQSVIAHLRMLWPERQAALMSAMLIGDRSGIRRQTSTEFQVSGTYHILVVSGINVGILAFVVFWALRRLRFNHSIATGITLALALGYNFIADTGAPIARATLMLALYLGTRLLYRDRSGMNSVGVAALIILVLDPQSLFEPSFQLTFLSVLAIAGIGAPVLDRSAEPVRQALAHLSNVSYDMSLQPWQAQFRLDLRMLADRLERFMGHRIATAAIVYSLRGLISALELLVISALMQVALALPMAWYFHRATTVGLAANIIAVPLAGVLMPAAVLAVSLSYVSSMLATPAALVARWSLDGITGTVTALSGLRVADVRLPTPGVLSCAFAVAAFVLALLLAPRRKSVAASGLALIFASALLIAVPPGKPQHRTDALEITAIDVGQGDSILVYTPEGKSLLLDSGGLPGASQSEFDVGEDVVSPYLWSRGISRLDAVAFSHGHADHIAGMCAVIVNFRPRELWMSNSAASPGVQHLLACAREYNLNVVTYVQGDEFTFGSARVRVLWPPRDWELKSRVRDDDSLVLHVSYGKTSALLEGDSEKKAELGTLTQAPKADLLKVGHHGSNTSTLPELLTAVKPEYAVISAGTRNQFKHPRPEVLERLAGRHVRTWRTDTNGATSFYLDGNSISVSPVLR